MSQGGSDSNILFFEPPPGGDITLRSNDGTSFRTHSLLMGLASSVFQDMLSVAVHGDGLIDLADDAESISLMLEHIYPVKAPNLQSIREYAKCLEIARKYDVKGMMETLNEQLCLGEKNKAVDANPVEACALASAFGLHDASKVAAQIADFKTNSRDPQVLARYQENLPQWKLPIRLVGMQAARAEALMKILFTFDEGVMTEFARGGGPFPLCQTCRRRAAGTTASVPIWLLRWSMAVYDLALDCDLQTLRDETKITDPHSVPQLVDHIREGDLLIRHCHYCVQYVQSCEDYPTWAQAVINVIHRRFSQLNDEMFVS